MKNPKLVTYLEASYIFVMTVCSVFYVYANFSKIISVQLGRAQLLYSLLVIIVFISALIMRKKGIHFVFYILYAIAQIVPIIYWTSYSCVNFNVFNGVEMSAWVGLPLHILLLCLGIYMAIIKKKSKI